MGCAWGWGGYEVKPSQGRIIKVCVRGLNHSQFKDSPTTTLILSNHRLLDHITIEGTVFVVGKRLGNPLVNIANFV